MSLKKILTIDNEKELFTNLKNVLLEEEYQVITAYGEKGLAKAQEESPDLIIIDTQVLPPAGYEVCRLLKDKQETKYIPVMMVSPRFDQDVIDVLLESAENLGAEKEDLEVNLVGGDEKSAGH